MSNLAKVVQQLRQERNQAQRKIEQMDAALRALTSLSGTGGATKFTRGRASRKRKPMSAAARKRIAAAQRARWAKWKAAKKR